MEAEKIIIKPLLTEKSYAGIQNKVYTFVVSKNAGKVEIKKAVEKLFDVKVDKVNIDAFKFSGSTLVVNDKNDKNIKLSTANIPSLSIEEVDNLNVYEVVANKNIVLSQSAIKQLEEAYAE